MFECASLAEILQLYQKVPPWRPKKPDMYWCAPARTRRAATPAISGVDAGYVRRSEVTQRIEAHADVGRSLTEQAIAQKADLLVMGCYGHSRLREFVLGGASRYQLRHMIIPVFMSH